MVFLFGRFLSRCMDIVGLIAGSLVALMMIQVAVDVAARYIFSRPLPATTVFIAQYYMLFVVFLPLALPERTNSHISVEIVAERFPMRLQYHLASWVHLLCAAIYGIIAQASWSEAMGKLRINATVIESGIAVPVWPGYFVVPIGCALMAIVLLYRFLIYLTGWKSGLGETPVPGAATADKVAPK